MDFKVAGTADAVTALQLDTKIDGLPAEVLSNALDQAKTARLLILEVLTNAIADLGPSAEWRRRSCRLQIPIDKIGEVIGPKGKSSTPCSKRPVRTSRSTTTASSVPVTSVPRTVAPWKRLVDVSR